MCEVVQPEGDRIRMVHRIHGHHIHDYMQDGEKKDLIEYADVLSHPVRPGNKSQIDQDDQADKLCPQDQNKVQRRPSFPESGSRQSIHSLSVGISRSRASSIYAL